MDITLILIITNSMNKVYYIIKALRDVAGRVKEPAVSLSSLILYHYCVNNNDTVSLLLTQRRPGAAGRVKEPAVSLSSLILYHYCVNNNDTVSLLLIQRRPGAAGRVKELAGRNNGVLQSLHNMTSSSLSSLILYHYHH